MRYYIVIYCSIHYSHSSQACAGSLQTPHHKILQSGITFSNLEEKDLSSWKELGQHSRSKDALGSFVSQTLPTQGLRSVLKLADDVTMYYP